MELTDLLKEFPKEAISWRAQSLTKDGKKALALAYIDARDVMNRLDEVIGPANWQDEYFMIGQRTFCKLGIKVDDNWVWKWDVAADTDVEAEKGAVSDAFKRAAVKWGIGRYLYAMPANWVPCESYDAGGKIRWSKFTQDPWDFVKTQKQEAEKQPRTKKEAVDEEETLLARSLTKIDAMPLDELQVTLTKMEFSPPKQFSATDLATIIKHLKERIEIVKGNKPF